MIKKKEYQARRKKLMDMIGSDSIAILPTASVHIRNRDVEFPFRPDSDFFYLTAYPEPEAVAVLIPDRDDGEFILFCRESDIEMETWHGRRAGLDGALGSVGDLKEPTLEAVEKLGMTLVLPIFVTPGLVRYLSERE